MITLMFLLAESCYVVLPHFVLLAVVVAAKGEEAGVVGRKERKEKRERDGGGRNKGKHHSFCIR